MLAPEHADVVEDAANPDDLLIEHAGGEVEEIDMPEELDETAKEAQKPGRVIEEALIEVTPENIHKYSIKDVVMPICGFKTRMPANKELTDIILGIMAEDKITMET